MGYYTELVVAFELKNDTPDKIINTLYYMIMGKMNSDIPPDREFLDKDNRCSWMLHSSSYYFAYPAALSNIFYNNITKTHHVSVRCNIKNYDDEINTFLTWIMPHIKSRNNNFLGYYMYENDKEPTMIYIKDGSASNYSEDMVQ